jgi:2-C-methyl-D-erythritol 4-phosphate cytidylyltransferase
VSCAFQAVDPHADIVVIHDAARPFATRRSSLAHDCRRRPNPAASWRRFRRAIPSSAPIEPQRPALLDDERFVVETLSRDEIFLAQTPQAFPARRARCRPVPPLEMAQKRPMRLLGGARRLPSRDRAR